MTDSLDERHKLLMDILLEVISRGDPITYKGIYERALIKNREVGLRLHFHALLPALLGELNGAIDGKKIKVPAAISAIVVNAQTRLPGSGIRGFSGFKKWESLDSKGKRETVAAAQQNIFSYQSWNKVYESLFNEVPKITNERDGKSNQGN
ncbi:hypothetical protein [Candidatus Spongiihabitans sp.]|uniref:hypothetical protein n=1 Tax=Candidatus Spongiihabitans sp. TaxID=3101308 RepID=UPI003C6EE89F